ncbi:hypothetical protein [Hymenobacter oligotrophus]|uniref:hypothetical protein n=1 Tax=Hymenobacter oligotrophus TaxID=2319843 RepID=UPI0013C36BE9|nr:hypothetical protein [Hymenobacter oligotrophus]
MPALRGAGLGKTKSKGKPTVFPGTRRERTQKNRSGNNRAANEGKAGKGNEINQRKQVSTPLQNLRLSRSALRFMLMIQKHVAKVSNFTRRPTPHPDIVAVKKMLSSTSAYITKVFL